MAQVPFAGWKLPRVRVRDAGARRRDILLLLEGLGRNDRRWPGHDEPHEAPKE